MQRNEHAARVVVGVDGSERNLAAVEWTAGEARDRGLVLLLVGVASPGSSSASAWPATDTLVRVGEPAHELREVCRPDDHVLGLSGLSTSRKVLHHATCPVAVVPVPVGDPDAFHFDDTDARSSERPTRGAPCPS